MKQQSKWLAAAMATVVTTASLASTAQAATPAVQKESTVSNLTTNTAEENTKVLAKAKSATATVESFIDEISPDVVTLSQQYGIYGSVMMAQAILESSYGRSALASAPNYNLFGIKGDYNGQYVNMKTLEDNGKGQYYTITAKFRKYPSYKESLEDNAKKLRYGVSWNAKYYSKTWRENAKTYKDATKALTGTYATDTRYSAKLNDLIARYDLTQFDAPLTTDSGSSDTTISQIGNSLSKGTTYVVKKGDTLTKIAKKYGTTVKNLTSWNSLKTTTIFVGQTLYVSKSVPTVNAGDDSSTNTTVTPAGDDAELDVTQKPNKVTIHTVKKGETLTKIAKTYGTTVTNLKKWNGLSSTTIKVGQKLKLNANANVTYKVAKGDTLTKIAKKYGTTVTNLKKWNGLKSSTIKIGQVLNVTKA
ncbi:LysM peptidoglycan-binding domain-containing protein [Kurthia huakuii]|uniref:LysM peptidoglycan-binding domain-containing protein n=1 Tax=Kurthia huakuii TaxID=1421019 RepID=UPI0004972EB9|nr:LysM peptidoglycan-binding domain-containing protein [Kurthia huakuii]MBM7698497.1 flagellum-specific peptidoglycan hydrolase FlgJ/transcriptional regulator [Kurthia huakuii]